MCIRDRGELLVVRPCATTVERRPWPQFAQRRFVPMSPARASESSKAAAPEAPYRMALLPLHSTAPHYIALSCTALQDVCEVGFRARVLRETVTPSAGDAGAGAVPTLRCTAVARLEQGIGWRSRHVGWQRVRTSARETKRDERRVGDACHGRTRACVRACVVTEAARRLDE